MGEETKRPKKQWITYSRGQELGRADLLPMGLGEKGEHMGREREHPGLHWEWSCPKEARTLEEGRGTA